MGGGVFSFRLEGTTAFNIRSSHTPKDKLGFTAKVPVYTEKSQSVKINTVRASFRRGQSTLVNTGDSGQESY